MTEDGGRTRAEEGERVSGRGDQGARGTGEWEMKDGRRGDIPAGADSALADLRIRYLTEERGFLFDFIERGGIIETGDWRRRNPQHKVGG